MRASDGFQAKTRWNSIAGRPSGTRTGMLDFRSESADAHRVSRWRGLRVGRLVHRSRALVLRRLRHAPARAGAPDFRPAFAVARHLFDRAHARVHPDERE